MSVQQEKIIDSEYCKEYLKSTYIKKKKKKKKKIIAVLRKANSHLVFVFILIKKSMI